jgi:peptide/nickel transport system permease protein
VVLRFIGRRLFSGALVIFIVSVVVFFISRVISDPTKLILPLGSTQAQRDQLRHQLGLDQPLIKQFGEFLKGLCTLNFGDSIWQHEPARELVMQRLPATFLLVGTGVLIALVVGLPMGVIAALYAGRVGDRLVTAVSLVGLSLPQFWLGSILIYFFALKLGWFPTFGKGGLSHLMLPALAIALPSGGRIAQVTRATVIDQMAGDYAIVAHAKGFNRVYVVTRHVLRNALIPIVTMAGWELTYGLAGYAVVVETVFAWPGFGYLAIQAIQRQDVYLIQAIVFVAAVIVVVFNLIIDLSYALIDPRIKLR